jgi:hypothetical protein
MMIGCGNTARHEQKAEPGKIIYYQLGDTRIPIHITSFGNNEDLVFINLHDNEFTSVEAAMPVMEENGGMLIRIDNQRQRVIRFGYHGDRYAFDPNRMFSDTGIYETLKEQSQYEASAAAEIKKFSERFLSLLPPKANCIFALHNNTDGGFSVLSYQEGGEYEGDARKVYRNPAEDPDDLIFTTDQKIYEKSVTFGFNSILQHNKKAARDGSLSVWAGENGWKYVNVETEHGKVLKFREMILMLVEAM